MQSPLSPPARRTLFAGSVILACVVAGILGWRQWRAPVQTEEVAAFLDTTVGAGNVRFTDVRIETVRRSEADRQLTVAATALTLVALYTKVDATDYLHGTLKLDPEATAEARRFMSDKDAAQKPEYLRLRPFPFDPYQAVVLRMTAQAGAPFAYRARVAAHRNGDTWTYTLVSGAYQGASPTGEERSIFGDSSFLEGNARDDAQLRAFAAELQAFAVREAETRRNLVAEHDVEVSVRRESFMARLAPGSVFRGVAQRSGEQQGTALYLEITSLPSANGATALMRNAGGWHYARAFRGTLSADDDFRNPTLFLISQPDQAIRNAGPLLENSQAWTLALRMDPKGSLSGANRLYQYRFDYVDPGQVPAMRTDLDAEFARAASIAAPGSLYRGTAVSKASGSSEPILLRFTGRSQDGESLQAEIESTSRTWKRPLLGSIIGNSRRSDGEPIRLRTGREEAVEEAPPESVLGARDDLEIRLGAEAGSPSGDDERFTYRFVAVADADLRKLDSNRAERAGRFIDVLRDGISYDGFIRDEQGYVTQARLEVDHIDRQKGAIAASIHSLVLLNVYQDFLGTWNPSDGSLALATTGRGQFDFSDSLAVPFLVAPVAYSLHLALVGNAITGGIKGDTRWAMEFPVDTFLSAPREGTETGPPASGGAFPPFPRNHGAYLLSSGIWRPLPRNNGHMATETVHPMTDEEASGGALGVLSQGVRRMASKGEKVSYLEFDGKDPRPQTGPAAVTLLFIGEDSTRTPQVELAPLDTLKDGRRRIEMVGGSRETARFGEQRCAAFVRRVGAGAVLLTSTAALAPGTYAFNADVGYELTISQ